MELLSTTPTKDPHQLWDAWTGPEVEGRLLGVQTLFLRAPFPHWLERPEGHYFFLSGFCYKDVQSALDVGKAVTIEVDLWELEQLPPPILSKAHILLRLPASPALSLLKPSDTVRLDAALYNVYAASWRCFVHSTPTDYEEDQGVYPASQGIP